VESLPREARNACFVGDVVRLKEVLRNLISNAIKFTAETGKVHVEMTAVLDSTEAAWQTVELKNRAEATVKPCGNCLLTVTDSGAGLTSEQLQNLFGEGVQFNANDLQQGQGSGVGLFITKGIVEGHQGTVRARSEGLGMGTTFVVELPIFHIDEEDDSDMKERSVPSCGDD
jgi:signal transduction histidine kinase